MSENDNKVKFLNTYVNNVGFNEAISYIDYLIQNKNNSYIVPINVDVVVKAEKDKELNKIIDEADLTLIDGTPLMWISKLNKKPFVEKISGSDLVPKVIELASKKKYRVFIIGGKEGIAERAKINIENIYDGINVVGVYAPPLGFENDDFELSKINKMISDLNIDILIVCFGCPKQEKWIYKNRDKYNAKVSICAGATVDFLAGNVKRAPKWMSNVGLEWFYRFLQEPRRLFKRYFVDDIKIINLFFKYRT